MAEAQISLENIVDNIKKVASELLPPTTKDGPKTRKGKEAAELDPLTVLGALRK